MSLENFIKEINQKVFYPVYCICGEESFLIHECVKHIEYNILTETQKQFDFSIFYGKDASFEQVFNACRKAAMLGEFNVVVLKDAQLFKDLKRLENYIQKPLQQTLLFFIYRDKLDTKTKIGSLLKDATKYYYFAPLKELEFATWVSRYVNANGFKIDEKALFLLIDQVGNDLTRVTNELQKIFINATKEKNINSDIIADFIGISKEYNIFEFQKALGNRDKELMVKMMKHFIAYPKENLFMRLNIIMYNYFAKLLIVAENKHLSDSDLGKLCGVAPYFLGDYKMSIKKYTYEEIENIILLLATYNLKSLGINTKTMSDADLKKELITKLLLI